VQPFWQHPQQQAALALAGIAAAASLLVGTPLVSAEGRSLTPDEKNTIALFQRSRPSVVYITSMTSR
jgi:hypothetical protein